MEPLSSFPRLPQDELAPGPKAAPGWMVTFADLLSLLLAFFVILFATSTIDQQQWQQHLSPISQYLTGASKPQSTTILVPVTTPAQHDGSYILALIQSNIEKSSMLAGITVEHRDGAVWIDLPDRPDGKNTETALAGLARIVAALDNHVEIMVQPKTRNSDVGFATQSWLDALREAAALAANFSVLKGGDAVVGTAGGGNATEGRVSLVIFDYNEDDHGHQP